MATLSHEAACDTADALSALPGVELLNKNFFNEFTLRLNSNAEAIVEKLAAKNILAGVPGSRLWPEDETLHNLLIIATTEMTRPEHISALTQALREVL